MGSEAQAGTINARGIALTLGFVAIIQAVALYFTYANAPLTSETGTSFAPAGTSTFGSVSNALILVVAVFATTLLAVWLIRNRKVRVFTSIIYVGTSLALFLLTLLTSLDISSVYLSEYTSLYLSLAASFGAVVLFALSARRQSLLVLAPVVTGLLSAEVGSYFAAVIPLYTALLLPLVFSIYDIYAVFVGPLRTLVTVAPTEVLSAVTSRLGEFSIGTGDTIFYSMLPALAFYQFNLTYALYTLVAVDVGVVITLYLLSRSRLLPGLPIPMALGLGTLLLLVFS
ncbi:MAG: hypothetical protein OK474_05825 [Thaumarchaeota archaeon]|nr:hypothetical protein [Nitrososphaerota archaeon]